MAAVPDSNFRTILGIRFFTGAPQEAVRIGLRGGLIVAPAAPALVEMERDAAYREALLHADLAITDSGFMVLIWNAIKRERITRVSGLEYLKLLVAQPEFRKGGDVFWVMPSDHAIDRGLAWLTSRGVQTRREDTYLAPRYASGNVADEALLKILQTRRPAQVVIALGGGVQEKLGSYLKRNSGYNSGIHCIGAAIGFLSGDQVNIPDWADKLFLGWFLRCVSQPGKFLPRYWKARRLLPMLLKYREQNPMKRPR
jgi:UDP-N-acetyl-D-mannosaminuronic acid transferase (WecB/TagA/CpsF family)